MPNDKPKRPSFIWDYGKCYDLEMYDPRLAGFEFALVETGIRGGRIALIKAPVNASTPSPLLGVEYQQNNETPVRGQAGL